MGLLYFEVEAKYDQLIKLRQEVAGLEAQMKNLGQNDTLNIQAIEAKCRTLTDQIHKMTNEAAQAGAQMQMAFRTMSNVQTGVTTSNISQAQSAISGGKAVGVSMAKGIEQADSAAKIFNGTVGELNNKLSGVMELTDNLGSIVGRTFGVGAIGMFINKVQEVRTYFQDIESSMRVFLGDQEKADKFTSELKSYAYYNMFEFSDLANGAKQLIAYGNATKDIIPIMDKLSNVATGTGSSLNELIFLYNRAKSTGQVMSREVQSWASKGIVLRDELKKMGVEASEGAITFNQLNQVLDQVTGKGGRFNNLMNEQMNNLSASKGQLQDNLDAMYNEIGEKLEPLLKGTIDLASWLVDNYEAVGKVILTLASTYGVYRTSLGITHALEMASEKTMLKKINDSKLVLKSSEQLVVADKRETKTHQEKVAAIRAEIAAQIELSKVLQGRTIAENKTFLQESIDKAGQQRDALESRIEKWKGIRTRVINQEEVVNKKGAKYSLETVNQQISQLEKKRGNYIDSIAANNEKLQQLISLEDLEAKTMSEETSATTLLQNAKESLMDKLEPLKAALTNPYFLAAAAVALLVLGIYKLKNIKSEEQKAYEKVNEEIEAYNSLIEARTKMSAEYVSTLKDETASLYEKADAYKKLIEMYPVLNQYTKDELKTMDVNKVISKENDKNKTKRLVQLTEEAKREKELAQQRLENAKNIDTTATQGSSYSLNGTVVSGAVNNVAATEIRQAQGALDWWTGRLNALEEQTKEYRKAMREQEIESMSHDDRKAILKYDMDIADQRFKIANDLYSKLNSLDENKNISDEERRQQSVKLVEEQLDSIDKRVKESQEKAAKDPLHYQAEFDSLSDLQKQLQYMQTVLQADMANNPLKVAFDFSQMEYTIEALSLEFSDALTGGGDDRKVKRQLRKKIAAFEQELNDVLNSSALTKEQKDTKVSSLYDSIIAEATNASNSMKDIDSAQNAMALANKLTSDRDKLFSLANSNFASLADDMSKTASSTLKQAQEDFNKEMSKYGNFNERYKAALNMVIKAQKDYDDKLEKHKNNTADISDEELKNAEEALKVQKQSLTSLEEIGFKYADELEAQREQQLKLARNAKDMEFDTRKQRIDAMKEGSQKEIDTIRLDFDKQKETIRRGYEDIKTQRADEAEKAWKNDHTNQGRFNKAAFLANYQYSSEEIALLDAQTEAAVQEYIAKLAKVGKEYETESQKREEKIRKNKEGQLAIEQSIAEIERQMQEQRVEGDDQALQNLKEQLAYAKQIAETLGYDKSKTDYYKEYGTARQKKAAINADYEYQIATAQSPYEKMALRKKLQEELSQVDMDILSRQGNWTEALGALGDIMPKYVRQTRDAVAEYIDSPAFKTLPPSEQASLQDIYSQLTEKAGYALKDIRFDKIGNLMDEYKAAVSERAALMQEEIQLEYDIMRLYGSTDKALEAAKNGDTQAANLIGRSQANTAKQQQNEQKLSNTQSGLARVTEATTGAVASFGDALSKLQSDSLSGIWEGIKAMSQSLSLGDLGGQMGGIVGAIVQVIDLIAENGMDVIIQTIMNTLTGLLTNLFGEGAGEWFDKTFGGGRIAFQKLEEETYRLSDAFADARGIFQEQLDEATGMDISKVGDKIEETYKKEIQGFRKLGKEYANTGASMFSHSTGYEEWADLDNSAKTYLKNSGVSKIADIFSLSVEKLKELKSNASVWSQLSDKVKDYTNQIIASQDAVDELENTIREKITNISFDSFYDSFYSTISDMEATTFEASQNMSKMFYESFLKAKIDEGYKDRIQKIYEEYSKAVESGNENDIEKAKQDYAKAVDDAIKERDNAAELTGYSETYTQQQKGSSYTTMSQETGTQLEGRFTAFQLSNEAIKMSAENMSVTQLPKMSESIDNLLIALGGDASQPISHILGGIHDTIAKTYLAVQGIKDDTSWMHEQLNKEGDIRGILETIQKNTSALKK